MPAPTCLLLPVHPSNPLTLAHALYAFSCLSACPTHAHMLCLLTFNCTYSHSLCQLVPVHHLCTRVCLIAPFVLTCACLPFKPACSCLCCLYQPNPVYTLHTCLQLFVSSWNVQYVWIFLKCEVIGWLIFSKKLKILIETIHNPQAMIEYRGQGLFLNLKLDPSLVYLKELQRNKFTMPCTWISQKDSLHLCAI